MKATSASHVTCGWRQRRLSERSFEPVEGLGQLTVTGRRAVEQRGRGEQAGGERLVGGGRRHPDVERAGGAPEQLQTWRCGGQLGHHRFALTKLGADAMPDAPNHGYVALAPLDGSHRGAAAPGGGLDSHDEALHAGRAGSGAPQGSGDAPGQRLVGGVQLASEQLGFLLQLDLGGQAVQVAPAPEDRIASGGGRQGLRAGGPRLEAGGLARRGLQPLAELVELAAEAVLLLELAIGDVRHVEHAGRGRQRFGQLWVLGGDVEPVQAVEQAELVAGGEHALLPGTTRRLVALGVDGFDDQHPGLPSLKVEAGQHLRLRPFDVHLAEMDRLTVEPGFGQEVVERAHRHADPPDRIALGLALRGLVGEQRAQAGALHDVEVALLGDGAGGHGEGRVRRPRHRAARRPEQAPVRRSRLATRALKNAFVTESSTGSAAPTST